MGQKHREIRKLIKREFQRITQWKENEFGELVKKVSRARVRQRVVFWSIAEDKLIERVCKRMRDDLIEIEDSRILAQIDACQTL